MVENPVAKTAQAVTVRFQRRLGEAQQSQEGFLQDILGFAVAQSERPAVKENLRSLRLIERLAPVRLFLLIAFAGH